MKEETQPDDSIENKIDVRDTIPERKWYQFLAKEMDDWKVIADNLKAENLKRTFEVYWEGVKKRPFRNLFASIWGWVFIGFFVFTSVYLNDNIRVCHGQFAQNGEEFRMTIHDLKNYDPGFLFIPGKIHLGKLPEDFGYGDKPATYYYTHPATVSTLNCTYHPIEGYSLWKSRIKGELELPNRT